MKREQIEGSNYCQKCIVDFMLDDPASKMLKYYKIERERLRTVLEQKLTEIKWLRQNLKEVELIINGMQVQDD